MQAEQLLYMFVPNQLCISVTNQLYTCLFQNQLCTFVPNPLCTCLFRISCVHVCPKRANYTQAAAKQLPVLFQFNRK